MKFSVTNLFTKRFFNEDKEEEGFIELRSLTVEKSKEISKKTTKTKFEFKRGQRFEVETVNQKLREELTWDYCIGAWENVIDDNGKEYENTKENKVLLMNNSNAFSTFVAEGLEEIDTAESDHAEVTEKN